MEEHQLDYALVPLGLAIFLAYHAWLMFTIIRYPRRTVIGINSESRHNWVLSVMTPLAHISTNIHQRGVYWWIGYHPEYAPEW